MNSSLPTTVTVSSGAAVEPGNRLRGIEVEVVVVCACRDRLSSPVL